MKKDQILARLREKKAELQAAGAEHISVFGSVAREENDADSDLDILVKLSDPIIQSGFGYFSALDILKEHIEAITGISRVDIVAEPLKRESFRRNVERDRAIAF